MDQLFHGSPSLASHSPMINYRKDAKKGVKFTFMVVGELGTGKTTFINSLLNKRVLSHRYETDLRAVGETKTLTFTLAKLVALPSTSVLTRNTFDPNTASEEPGIALTETRVEMVDDDNMKLLLNIIEAPGFGENLNNDLCFAEIENFLKQQFDLVLAEETRIKRNPRFVDTRVHVLLYFIAATGHGLRELDISCMKRLSKYVNILPVISKADSFTEQELAHFKQQVKVDIEKFNVPIFQFDSYLNDYDENEDYELIQECKFLSRLQPFAIIASEDDYEVRDPQTGQNHVIKARQYPWGLVDVNNPKYSDFPVLKLVILGSHLQDLKDLTHDFLYETYRTERLTKVTGKADDDYDDSEFHDTVEEPGSKMSNAIPSLSNLAQLTSTTALDTTQDDDTALLASESSKKPKSMLLDDLDNDMPSPKLRDSASFTLSGSTLSLDTANTNSTYNPPAVPRANAHNSAFKRMLIAPQRNQLRQISETVPYVIRHERILERQQKLEEMEMASAKELASRAALLEQKAALLKAKEKALMQRLEAARQVSGASEPTSEYESDNRTVGDDASVKGGIRKDETLTDLHSIVGEK